MKPIFWASLLCLPLWLPAQNTYVKTIGTTQSDFGTSCIPTPDLGSVLTVCGGMPNVSGVQFGLVKTDHNGTLEWSKLFVQDTFALPQTVVRAADGGFVVFGSVAHPSGSGQALFLLKTDAQGNIQWSYRLPASDNDRPVGLLACKAGGYVSCSVWGYNGPHPCALLIRYEEDGNVAWAKKYEGPYAIKPAALTELPNGDIAFVSSARFFLTDPFPHMLVTRTDAEGNMRWSSFLGLEYDDEPYDITANALGELYVTGGTYRMGHEWDGFLLKMDAEGKRVFNRFYDAGTFMGELFRSVMVTPQGSVRLLGDMGAFEERDITLLSVDDQGQTQWAKRYPFSPSFTNYPSDMYGSYNGGIVFTGDVRPPSALRNAALVRTDSLGNVPCHNEPASYALHDMAFWQMNPTVSVFPLLLPTPDSLAFTHPLQPIMESVVCENPQPVVLSNWYASYVCPKVCMDFQDSTLNGPTAWLWEFEGATPSSSTQQHPQNICYAEKGTYTVSLTATNALGTVTQHKKIVIHEPDCPPPVVPNVFTPNGDEVNDEFLIDQLPDEFTLHVYNRWGEVVFQASDKSQVWNGKNRWGLPVPDGVYFYSLSAYDKDYHGFIHVFR